MSTGKVCMVCGDKALGYNFNAVTCESCKAFFRRNALSNKEFTCPFSEDCNVTVVTRRFCQKCRLQKCFKIGMKKEYIMSEEDKFKKRKKIELNRAKKRLNGAISNSSLNEEVPINKVKREESSNDGHGCKDIFVNLENSHHSASSVISNVPSPENFGNIMSFSSSVSGEYSLNEEKLPAINNNNSNIVSKSINDPLSLFADYTPMKTSCNLPVCSVITSTSNSYPNAKIKAETETNVSQMLVTAESSPSEIVSYILNSEIGTKNTVDRLMRTAEQAVYVMSKIINSPKDAMELIGHFISSPGDALHIISKIMNSPLDALTVFTQFMSSPTDAFQIIGKIISSPTDVLQFMQQLMKSPENALQIMHTFMNSPVEALKIINKMINNPQADSTTSCYSHMPNHMSDEVSQDISNNIMIRSMLNAMKHDNPLPHIIEPTSTNPNTSPSLTTSYEINNGCINISSNQSIESNGFKGLQRAEDVICNVIENVHNTVVIQNTFESVLCETIRLEYESVNVQEHLRLQPFDNNLNSIEQSKLKELIIANEALYDPVDIEYDLDSFTCQSSGHPNPELLRVINLTAIAVRRLIKMAKKINAFKNMCQQDQLALLKGGCIEMMILRSVVQFDEDKNTWKIPHSKPTVGNIRADVLKLAKGNIYEKHKLFISNFDKKWRSDINIIPIMCAITLFTPNRSKIVHSDVIKLEQTSYYCLLRRYLESIYTGCEAKSTFLKLVNKLHELQKLNDEVINVYLDVNPAQVEPLLLEIFDLKQSL